MTHLPLYNRSSESVTRNWPVRNDVPPATGLPNRLLLSARTCSAPATDSRMPTAVGKREVSTVRGSATIARPQSRVSDSPELLRLAADVIPDCPACSRSLQSVL